MVQEEKISFIANRKGISMIKNIVFDVGKVLVDFNWQKVFEELQFTGIVYEKVAQATVLSNYWNEFDKGVLSEEEILEGFLKGAPKYQAEILKVWEYAGNAIVRYDYTIDWINSLKKKGYQVYLLSNYPKRLYELSIEELSFVNIVDGGIFSYQIKCVKPDPKIYQALFEKYNLKPEECVFLDDNEANVIAAEKLGMSGIQFQNKKQAEKELEKIIAVHS